jgi:hypothetical protein
VDIPHNDSHQRVEDQLGSRNETSNKTRAKRFPSKLSNEKNVGGGGGERKHTPSDSALTWTRSREISKDDVTPSTLERRVDEPKPLKVRGLTTTSLPSTMSKCVGGALMTAMSSGTLSKRTLIDWPTR